MESVTWKPFFQLTSSFRVFLRGAHFHNTWSNLPRGGPVHAGPRDGLPRRQYDHHHAGMHNVLYFQPWEGWLQ